MSFLSIPEKYSVIMLLSASEKDEMTGIKNNKTVKIEIKCFLMLS